MVSNSARKKAAREHQLLHGGTYASALAAVKKIEASVPSLSSWTLSRMIEDGVLSDGTAAFLKRCVAVGRVVVIAGPIGSGRNALLNALVRGIREDARVGIVARGDWKGLDELVPHLNNAVVAEVPSGLTPSLDWEFSLSRQQLEYLVVDEIIEPGDGHFFTRFVSENVCGALATIQGQTADEALSRMAANFAALPVTETTRVRADGIEDIEKFIHEVVNVVVVMKPGGVRGVPTVSEVAAVSSGRGRNGPTSTALLTESDHTSDAVNEAANLLGPARRPFWRPTRIGDS